MLFFQQSAITDKGLTTRDIRMGRVDTLLGAAFATVAAVATLLATAPLFTHHMSAANFEAGEFAQALQPFVGHWGAALFALGMFEAGWSQPLQSRPHRRTPSEKWRGARIV